MSKERRKKRNREVKEKQYKFRNKKWEYLDVDLIPLYPTAKKPKADPAQESTVIQRNLNDRNSVRLFERRALNNFGPGDYFLSPTYCDRYLPGSMEAAAKELRNYIARIRYACKKSGLPSPKYLYVVEVGTRQTGKRKGEANYHYHILLSCGLPRDQIEDLWSRPRRKGQEQGDRLGDINVDRCQFREDGIPGIIQYMVGREKKQQQAEEGFVRGKHKRYWSGSQNLTEAKPKRPNETRWSDRQISKAAKQAQETGKTDHNLWEKAYPGYRVSMCEVEFNEVTNRWSIYLRMYRRL